MSLRTWNTSFERKKLQQDIHQLTCIIDSISSTVESEEEDDDDDDSFFSLSSSSSSSSISSFSSMDLSLNSESDDDLDFVEMSTQCILVWAHRVLTRIENEKINFGQRMFIVNFSDSECIAHFRFRKVDLQTFADVLWPRISPFLGPNKDDLTLQNRYHAPFETCLLIYLFKMSRPRRLHEDCESVFGMRKSHLSSAILTFARGLFLLSIKYLLDPRIWHSRMPYYASLVSKLTNQLMTNIWGFIDGTYRPTSRPIRYQHLCYTKFKKCHAIKFQSIVTPDGMIAYLFGPFVGKRHDARMLSESGLMNILQDLMPIDGSNGLIYSLYGDLAYPQSIWLFGGFLNPAQDSQEAQFNKQMSQARIAVEWGFNDIVTQFRHLDLTNNMKWLKEPMAVHYMNCAFLCNVRNCYYGNECLAYFGAQKIDIHEYLELID